MDSLKLRTVQLTLAGALLLPGAALAEASEPLYSECTTDPQRLPQTRFGMWISGPEDGLHYTMGWAQQIARGVTYSTGPWVLSFGSDGDARLLESWGNFEVRIHAERPDPARRGEALVEAEGRFRDVDGGETFAFRRQWLACKPR